MTEEAQAPFAESVRKTVLVVDDEPDITVYLAALLRDNGYETIEARSAEEATKRVLDSRPDLISLDLMMPEQSGLAFYRKLKMDARTKDIPAIFVSAFSSARDFRGSGFRRLVPDKEVPEPEGFVEKPVQPSHFLEAVRTAIA